MDIDFPLDIDDEYWFDKFPPLIALDICAHAARSMGHILEDVLSHIYQDDDAFLEVMDVPTLLIGTFAPAITLFIVQTTKGHIGSYGDLPDSHVPDIDSISQESDEEIFEVFLETFRRAQTRWVFFQIGRAFTHALCTV